MRSELKMEATPKYMENHKAYVQFRIGPIREKPEILLKAIKDAQVVTDYMDYKVWLMNKNDTETL